MPDRTNRIADIIEFDSPFTLECGETLERLTVAYETYGRPDENRSNAVLICHALTGSAHAAGLDEKGRAGWWDGLIGRGRAFDPADWHIICPNVLGSCYGTTGPTSINPATGVPYGDAFPVVTIRDMVRVQRLLLDRLGIDRLRVVIGGSMGGMQVLEWGVIYPESIDLLIPIATSARHSPWAVAFNAIAREAIALGARAGDPDAGLRLARKVAMMTYRHDLEFSRRFGRDRKEGPHHEVDGSFQVESWLQHHGERLVERFDPATFNTITRAMDLHDVTHGRGPLAVTLGTIRQPALCIGITSDILYPAAEQRDLARLLPDAIYREITSDCGHDAFLIEFAQLNSHVGEFLAAHPAPSRAGAELSPA